MCMIALVVTFVACVVCGARRRLTTDRRQGRAEQARKSLKVLDEAPVGLSLVELQQPQTVEEGNVLASLRAFARLFLSLNSAAAWQVPAYGRSFYLNHPSGFHSRPHLAPPVSQYHDLGLGFLQQRPRWQSAVLSASPATSLALDTASAQSDSEAVQQLQDATREFKELKDKWKSLRVVTEYSPEIMRLREEYLEKDTMLRNSLSTCPYGDPAATASVARHTTGDDVLFAHSEATLAIYEVEMAHLEWEVRCMDAQQAADPTAETHPQLDIALVQIAVLKIRVFDLDGAYDCIQRAAGLGSQDPRLDLLTRYCAQLKAPRFDGFMTGADMSAGSEAEQLLKGIKSVFLSADYYKDTVIKATKARSLAEFIMVDTKADKLEQDLLEAAREPSELERDPNKKKDSLPPNLVVLIRIFLLHRVVPLSRISLLFGPEALKLLLSLQVIRAIEGSACRLVSPDEAVAAVDADANSCGGFFAFSAIAIWPVEDDLIIATDFEQAYSAEDLEPVMYISEDSSALVYAAPRDPPVDRLLDVCTGSGIQGIVGLRYYAKTCAFTDLNPRALRFTKFNLAMNGYADRAIGFYEGSVYDSLPAEIPPFDAIVANPPFVPNPENIASGAGAMYGNGGSNGERVLEALVSGAHRVLKPGGRLATVSMAPNVEEMPARVEKWYSSEAKSGGCEARIFRGATVPAKQYLPTGTELEKIRYQRAFDNLGIATISEILMVIQVGGASPHVTLQGDPRHELWQDDVFLRAKVQTALSGIEAPTPAQQDLHAAAKQSEAVARAEAQALKAAAQEAETMPSSAPEDGALASLRAARKKAETAEVAPEQNAAEKVKKVEAVAKPAEEETAWKPAAQAAAQKPAQEVSAAKVAGTMPSSTINNLPSDEANFTGVDFKEIEVEWLPKGVAPDEVFAVLDQRGVLGSRLDDMVRYTNLAFDIGHSLPNPTRQSILNKVKEVHDWSKTLLPSTVLEAKITEMDNFMSETVKRKHAE